MDAIRQAIAAIYIAAALAGGKEWIATANGVLGQIAEDDETNAEAAHILRVLAKQAKAIGASSAPN